VDVLEVSEHEKKKKKKSAKTGPPNFPDSSSSPSPPREACFLSLSVLLPFSTSPFPWNLFLGGYLQGRLFCLWGEELAFTLDLGGS
jgi:hypothetical protein